MLDENVSIIRENLIEICGKSNISDDENILKEYMSDLSFVHGITPLLIVWPINTKQIAKIVESANQHRFYIVPVSSSSKIKLHGDTIPQRERTIIMNMSKMKNIISIDTKNRVVMIEPGVTFSDLVPKLRKLGVRLLMPLNPTVDKSVVTSALEREPITIPRYHWDSSDPLLCTEIVFGTGDLFRTGAAAGPGSLKEQKKTHQAQKNPMGPTQFSPFRIIQGAQGSIGIVTWASLKLEYLPSIQKVFHYQSEDLRDLLKLQQKLIKYRLCDEIFLLNDLNLACLLKNNPQEIQVLSNSLLKWNLIYVISGKGKLAEERIKYLEKDIEDIIEEFSFTKLKSSNAVEDVEILNSINYETKNPWRLRYKNAFQDVFFLSSLENVPEFISLVENEQSRDVGVYIQACNQGTSYHCEFDIYYDSDNEASLKEIEIKLSNLYPKLLDAGAFFSRPYKICANEVFNRHSEEIVLAMRKVKDIFDPNYVLNPGVMCFDKN